MRGRRTKDQDFTDEQILKIREDHAAGELGKDLAVDYGVHPSTISQIVLRKTYKRVGLPPENWPVRVPATAKLKKEQVLAIRKDYAELEITLTDLAQEYHVALSTIWRIVHRVSWAHIQ